MGEGGSGESMGLAGRLVLLSAAPGGLPARPTLPEICPEAWAVAGWKSVDGAV